MKKIFVSFICFTMILLLTGCGNKTKIDGNKFRDVMEEKGFFVVEAGNTEENKDKTFVAQEKDGKYQIEFYELDNENSAKTKFNDYKNAIDDSSKVKVGVVSSSGNNYNKYSLIGGKTYYILSRIDNTIIFLSVDKSYKNEVKNIVKELGY